MQKFIRGLLRGRVFIGGNFMSKLGAKIKHPKQQGEWAELCFMVRAAEKGLQVSKPWGETAHYHCGPSPFRKVCGKMEYRLSPFLRQSHRLDLEKGPGVTVEDLGSSTISGVEVEGKRVTRVIPEGTVGNDRPFATATELWHSKQLDVDVQVKRTDPRMGTRTPTMTEVSLSEPDPKYFRVPEGYRTEQRQPSKPLAPLASEPLSPAPTPPPNR